MEFFLELALTISLPLLISFVITKLFSRGSTDEELAPFGFDLQFGSRIHNLESGKPSVVVEDFVGGDEIVECQPKQGDSTAIVESRDETESKCDAAVIDSQRIVEKRVESDYDNGDGDCGGEVGENAIDESSVRARCEETGINRDKEDVREDFEVEAVESDRSKVSGEVNDEGRSAEEIAVEDDDWEGIERTELERLFEATVECVKIHDSEDPNFGSELKMRLGGLHKIATEGPCREPPPMALKISARAKWYSELLFPLQFNCFLLFILLPSSSCNSIVIAIAIF